MNFRKYAICFSFVLFCFSQLTFAGNDAPSTSIKTIATVINYLNHYPEDTEKAKLQKIIDDAHAAANEKTIASALMHMKHSVTADDKEKLSEIMADNAAPQAVRDLAKIAHDLEHKASAADKAVLKKYMW